MSAVDPASGLNINWTRQAMQSQFRMIAVAALLIGGVSATADPTYFVVSEHPGQETINDSYILPLEDPDAIQHARDLIKFGANIGNSIVVARIMAGSDHVNRNIVDEHEPLWSWHVSEFLAFTDNSAEILDGWPGFVEEDVNGWIRNTNGMIGFWNYTVTAELGPQTPADLNGDGVVDGADLAQLLAQWGASDTFADLNLDGVVDGGDLAQLLANWTT